MSTTKLFFSTLYLFIFFSSINAGVKGLGNVVSIEPAPLFSSVDTDNILYGFGWFKHGFTLEDAQTTCTFDSVYPVSGGVDLNGGTLYLKQDLLFKNIT